MAKVLHTVKPRKQSNKMSCWHACVLMLNDFYKVPTSYALLDRYMDMTGIYDEDFAELAMDEGLTELRQRHAFTEHTLMDALRNYGPIFAPGDYGNGPHIVLVTGADDVIIPAGNPDGGEVYYNDPATGSAQSIPLAWFNASVHLNMLLVKDPAALVSQQPEAAALPPRARRNTRIMPPPDYGPKY